MLLQGKVAVIYGGGGSIGGAIARAYAREGATVFLAGRTQAKLDAVADDIRRSGGTAETTVVDARDQEGVEAFVKQAIAQAGRIDISFNVIGYDDIQGPLLEISVTDFLQPIVNAMRSQFLTSRAVAQHMIDNGGGVILHFGGGGPQTNAGLGGFKIALDAIEGLRRQLALELGKHNIRVLTLKTGGITESIDDSFEFKDKIEEVLTSQTQLGRTATLADVGNVAAFAASGLARSITSTEINISCGAIVD